MCVRKREKGSSRESQDKAIGGWGGGCLELGGVDQPKWRVMTEVYCLLKFCLKQCG